jgi:hypothetical protein
MTLKNAAFLALIGTLLTAVVQAFHLILDLLSILRGLVPAVALFASLLYAFAWFTLAVFFFVQYKNQS